MFKNESYLLEELKRGNEAAYEYIFKNFYKNLVIYCYNLCKQQDRAEDIVQNVLVKLWSKRERLKISSSLKNYLYRAVYNEFVTEYHKEQKKIDAFAQIKFDTINDIASLNEDINSERLKLLKKAIDQLPDKCREVFVMSKLQGYKYREIAEILDISEKTVEKHISKGYTIIKKFVFSANNLIQFLFFR